MSSMHKLIRRDSQVREWANAFIDGRKPKLTEDQLAAVHRAIDDNVNDDTYTRWLNDVHANQDQDGFRSPD